ncbi:MAG: AGE family epimerase/isomerase [Hyphomonas sp.]
MAAPPLHTLQAECEAELHRLVAWWTRHIVRPEGGYHGKILLDGQPDMTAPVSAILGARLLWFFSAAAQITGYVACRAQADRAADWFHDRFLDPAYGGLLWSVMPNGEVHDGRKHAYAQAFGLYAFAMHYRLSGAASSRAAALSLFRTLETHYRDPVQGGYREAFARDFSPIPDHRLSEKEPASPKTMNTHLHVLEAFTELARSDRSADILAALEHALTIFLDHIVHTDQRSLAMFLTDDWQDESRAISFGHDIEASWLICEAADVLGDEPLRARAQAAAIALADAVLTGGTGPEGQVHDEREHSEGHIDRSSVWWIQAEALVGFLNAFERSADERFADAALRCWSFIRTCIIDPEGEWRSNGTPDGHMDAWWAGPWKACYHNGRAMMETAHRVRRLAAAPLNTGG